MMKRYICAFACSLAAITCANAQKTSNYRWEFNMGMVNPFSNSESLFQEHTDGAPSLLPSDKSLGLGIKYAFGSYAWRFSVAGNSAYYSFVNPDVSTYRYNTRDLEEANIEFRMGVEKRIEYKSAQFYFGSDLIMGRVRRYEEGRYELLESETSVEWWKSHRTKVSGIGFMVGMKYFIHDHFSILLETRADALGYEILKGTQDTESVKDTAAQFVLKPFGMMSINYHF